MVDTVVIKQPTAPQEDQAHIDAMVAKADGVIATADQAGDSPAAKVRPDWVPEKFWDTEKGEIRTEDMAKSYKELESSRTKPQEQAPEDDKKAAPSEPTQDDASKALADKGLSFDEFSAEFAANGELSAESYAALEKAHIPKAVVDQYIAGQQALAARYEADVKSAAGGEEGFAEMAAWAKANLSKEEAAAYNKAVDSGDVNQAKLAVAGLYQKFQSVGRGAEPQLVTGVSGRPGLDAYESVAQLQKDMSNPDYKKDPAFRRQVQEKLGRSSIL